MHRLIFGSSLPFPFIVIDALFPGIASVWVLAVANLSFAVSNNQRVCTGGPALPDAGNNTLKWGVFQSYF